MPDAMRGLPPLNEKRLAAMLGKIRDVRVAVLGDYCLDIYWFVDASRSERSLETGLPTHPVSEQRYALGGAGNVVNNLVAIGCRNVFALGVVGNDPWGREMLRLLGELGVGVADLLVQDRDWATLAYNKPHVAKMESNRFDFGNFNQLAPATAKALLARCRERFGGVDAVIVNQQVLQGLHTPAFRADLVDLMRAFPQQVFVADSRHYSNSYLGAVLKINDHEAARLCGVTRAPEELVLREETLAAAEALYARFAKAIVVTRGSRGLVVRDAAGVCEVPGIQVTGPIDPVGAGDSALAGLSLGLAAGCDAATAAQLGNFTAAVTIQKLNQTGTATPEEILAIGREGAYVFTPELAEDPRRACVLPGTEIEVVRTPPAGLRVTHAIFDHDGTISTLREGWERVMEPMMVRAILGPQYRSADESLYLRAVQRVRQFIDQTTGYQTLVQMEGLIRMVREFACVPEPNILDAAGYKAIYNEALMEMVRGRIDKLHRGELGVEDFTVKNAVALLRRLRDAGVRMYLASGTDRDDVIAEAEALGYAGLFAGGLFGSTGDIRQEAKRVVLDRILQEIGAEAAGLVTFGDGPVEMRETRRRGGVAVGVASDEIRRFGLNPSKRSRLIRAGADLIVPDFSRLEPLLALLLPMNP